MVLEMDYNQVLEHVQINNIVLAAAGDGVISGLDVTEKGTPDMSVDVAAGSCMVGGTKYTESGTVNLAIAAAHATLARKDIVIYDVGTTNPLIVTGTPATPPIPPDITAGDILLAIVDVAATDTTITNSEITDCIVEITKLDELAAPSDNANLNASTAVHGLLKKLNNSSSQFMNGQGNWATPAGAGDMSKSVYDTNDNGVVDSAEAVPWAGITGKPSTYVPSAHGPNHQSGGSDAIKLDDFATPDDNTDLDASTSVHGLLKKLNNNSGQYLNGQGNWAAPSGSGDMLKSTYDPNYDGIIAVAQTEANNYAHPSARQCSTGTWAWTQVTGEPTYCTRWPTWSEVTSKPSTFTPSAHNQSAATITSGILAVARGGTGVSDDSYDADKVDGCDAGTSTANVYKLLASSFGAFPFFTALGMSKLDAGTDGYRLTTHSTTINPAWEAASDLIFSDTHCPKCGEEFQDGDDLILHVIGHNEVGDILTLPMHLSCANAPKKIVTVKRKVMEDQYILDEATGELKVQRVQKTVKKTVTRHKLKEGCIIDGGTGKAHTIDDKGIRGNAMHKLTDAIEKIEEEIEEVVYEDVEYKL